MDKKQVISKLEQSLLETQKICPNLKGFIIYGNFVTEPNPREVDIIFLYEKRPVTLLMGGDKDAFDSIERAKKYLRGVDPIFQINHSNITSIACKTTLNYELDSKSVKKYYFIGDKETQKKLEQITPDRESASF